MPIGDVETPADENPSDAFREQAAATGLVLPRRRPWNPLLAIAIVGVIVAGSAGVGYASGWLNPSRPVHGSPQLLGPQDCHNTVVPLRGAVLDGSNPVQNHSWGVLGAQFSNSTGGCAALAFNASSGDTIWQQLAIGQADFAVTETLPTPAQQASLPGPVDNVPIALDAIAVVYNLPGHTGGLNLSGSALAGIFLGTITTWSDPALLSMNPGLTNVPSQNISVIYRSDSTAVNEELTSFLSRENLTWSNSFGVSPVASWPVGTGADSAAKMVEAVGSTPGSIGYVETDSPSTSGLACARIQNDAGTYVPPDPVHVAAAAISIQNTSSATNRDWANVSTVDVPGNDSYPLAMFSYVVVPQDLGRSFSPTITLTQAQWLMTFLWWVTTGGQTLMSLAGFTPLPFGIVSLTQQTLEEVGYNGTSVLFGTEGGGEGGGETGVF
jgi:phosphate transport system substrate-binding protein